MWDPLDEIRRVAAFSTATCDVPSLAPLQTRIYHEAGILTTTCTLHIHWVQAPGVEPACGLATASPQYPTSMFVQQECRGARLAVSGLAHLISLFTLITPTCMSSSSLQLQGGWL